ncbi:MAG: type II toxin-antitoxin system HicA family toxin [Pseudonocardiales bacterium]
MPPVPAVPGVKLRRALEKIGFEVVRVNGSHHVMKHPDGRHVAVPVHSGRDVPKGTLRGVLSIIGLSVEDLTKLL